jgi:hypothetical protein
MALHAYGPRKSKAKKILRDGKVHGKPLSAKQKGLMGARAGGAPMKPKAQRRGKK